MKMFSTSGMFCCERAIHVDILFSFCEAGKRCMTNKKLSLQPQLSLSNVWKQEGFKRHSLKYEVTANRNKRWTRASRRKNVFMNGACWHAYRISFHWPFSGSADKTWWLSKISFIIFVFIQEIKLKKFINYDKKVLRLIFFYWLFCFNVLQPGWLQRPGKLFER